MNDDDRQNVLEAAMQERQRQEHKLLAQIKADSPARVTRADCACGQALDTTTTPTCPRCGHPRSTR